MFSNLITTSLLFLTIFVSSNAIKLPRISSSVVTEIAIPRDIVISQDSAQFEIRPKRFIPFGSSNLLAHRSLATEISRPIINNGEPTKLDRRDSDDCDEDKGNDDSTQTQTKSSDTGSTGWHKGNRKHRGGRKGGKGSNGGNGTGGSSTGDNGGNGGDKGVNGGNDGTGSSGNGGSNPTETTSSKSPSSTKPSSSSSSSGSSSSSSGSGDEITGGEATFFNQGGVAGACGIVHQDSDFVVAEQTQRFGNGADCGRTVKITNTQNGKSVTATVADECPSCQGNPNSLDLSIAAFDAIADPVTGIVPITWEFTD